MLRVATQRTSPSQKWDNKIFFLGPLTHPPKIREHQTWLDRNSDWKFFLSINYPPKMRWQQIWLDINSDWKLFCRITHPPKNETTPVDLAWHKFTPKFFSWDHPNKWDNTDKNSNQIFFLSTHLKWDNTRFCLIEIQAKIFFLGLPTQNEITPHLAWHKFRLIFFPAHPPPKRL